MATALKLEGDLASIAREAREAGAEWQIYHSERDNSVRWIDTATGNEIAAHSYNIGGRPLIKLVKSLRASLDNYYKDQDQKRKADEIAQAAADKKVLPPSGLSLDPPPEPEVPEEPIQTELRSLQDVGPRFTVRLAHVPVEAIKVDGIEKGGYQRPPQIDHAVGLARKFSWDDFDRMALSERDGYFWILDGQHRMIALSMTDRVPDDQRLMVPAVVYEGMSRKDEADYYLRQNTDRKNTHPIHAWKARLVTDPKAQEIEKIAEDNGYQIGTGGVGYIPSISSLEEIYDDFGPVALADTLSVLKASWPTDRISAPLLRGMSFVIGLYDEIDYARLVRRLSIETAHAVHAKVRFLASANKGTQTVMCARYIVDSYNSKLSARNILGSFDDLYAEFLAKKKRDRAASSAQFFSRHGQKAVAKPGTWLATSREYDVK